MNGLARLEEWLRKGYTFQLHGGPCYSVGEILNIILKGGKRTLAFNIEDMFDVLEDVYPSFEDFVNWALDKWYEDKSLKLYNVSCHPFKDITTKKYTGKCTNCNVNDYFTTIILEGNTEQEVINTIRQEFSEKEYMIYLKEI